MEGGKRPGREGPTEPLRSSPASKIDDEFNNEPAQGLICGWRSVGNVGAVAVG